MVCVRVGVVCVQMRMRMRVHVQLRMRVMMRVGGGMQHVRTPARCEVHV